MYINTPSHKQDSLYQDAMELAGISDTSVFTLSSFIRSANDYYRRADTWINEATGDWQFDDSNFSDTPVLQKDSVAGKATYRLHSNTRRIERVEIKGNDGIYYPVDPIEKSQIKDLSLSEFYKTSGNPFLYDLSGRNITFYPPFSDARTNGIRIYVSRDVISFSTQATNREPGFDNHFHRIISFGAAYDQSLMNRDRERANDLRAEIERMRIEMKNFYSKRHPNYKAKIRPSVYESASGL